MPKRSINIKLWHEQKCKIQPNAINLKKCFMQQIAFRHVTQYLKILKNKLEN